MLLISLMSIRLAFSGVCPSPIQLIPRVWRRSRVSSIPSYPPLMVWLLARERMSGIPLHDRGGMSHVRENWRSWSRIRILF